MSLALGVSCRAQDDSTDTQVRPVQSLPAPNEQPPSSLVQRIQQSQLQSKPALEAASTVEPITEIDLTQTPLTWVRLIELSGVAGSDQQVESWILEQIAEQAEQSRFVRPAMTFPGRVTEPHLSRYLYVAAGVRWASGLIDSQSETRPARFGHEKRSARLAGRDE